MSQCDRVVGIVEMVGFGLREVWMPLPVPLKLHCTFSVNYPCDFQLLPVHAAGQGLSGTGLEMIEHNALHTDKK